MLSILSLKCCQNLRKLIKSIFVFAIISPHWDGTGSLYLSSWRKRTCLFYMVNIMAAADLVMPEPGPRFNIKMPSYRYRKSHCGDKTVVRSSYLHNGISYTGKMTSLYWIRTQTTSCHGIDPAWHGISNHWQHDCWFSSLFRLSTNKSLKLCIAGSLWGKPPVTGGFPSQRASDVERVSMSWCHHAFQTGEWGGLKPWGSQAISGLDMFVQRNSNRNIVGTAICSIILKTACSLVAMRAQTQTSCWLTWYTTLLTRGLSQYKDYDVNKIGTPII